MKKETQRLDDVGVINYQLSINLMIIWFPL
jgi:hypothetical protein